MHVLGITIADARALRAAIVGVIKKEILKMRSNKHGILDYCPLCKTELPDTNRVTRWIHDIMNHRKYFESQTARTNREQVLEILYEIIEHYYRDDKT